MFLKLFLCTFAMKTLKPLIRYNNGKPIALCNRCFTIMCQLSCEIVDINTIGDCVIIDKHIINDKFVTSTPIGKKPPIYCDDCKKLLQGYCLNE